jgi:HPt (histidine-containing phosphotransfer) domain-containing protein
MTHEDRLDAWKLKQANQTMGKQGQTIHNLRAEKEELLSLISKNDRGDLRRLERLVPELRDNIEALIEDLHKAHERIKELEEFNEELTTSDE